MRHRTTKDNIGKIYGCYEIIDIAEVRITPSGQRKQYYKCKCVNCGNIKEINAYKLIHNNYQHCNKCKPKQQEVIIDIIGKKFGRLTVIDRINNHTLPSGQTKVMYRCACDCGNDIIVSATHLMSGHTTSCGCLQVEIVRELLVKDLSNQKFGKLTVVSKNKSKNGRQLWNCKCDCGRTAIASSVALTSGRKKSCGCLASVAEYEFATYLDENNYKYIPQYTFNDCKDKRKLPFDFGIKNNNGELVMLVELHGQQHYAPFTYCNEPKEIKIKNYENRKRKDIIKENYCKEHNIPLLIIKYSDFNKKEQIFDDFYHLINNEREHEYA